MEETTTDAGAAGSAGAPGAAGTLATGDQVIARIQSMLGSLVASEARVAEVVLERPRDVIGLTASQLGARANTSATTVIRFARTVGFTGYQQLAIGLAVSEQQLDEPVDDGAPSDSAAELLASVAARAARTVRMLPAAIDPAVFEGATEALAAAGHVVCVASSLTAPVALDVAYRLNHLGLPAEAPQDSQIQRIRARSLGPGDVCIAILHGGTYPRVVEAARDAAAAGATVIALTSFGGTPLADVATFPLVVGADSVRSGVDAWSSRLAFLLAVDALVLAIRRSDPVRFDASLDAIGELIEEDRL
ncbi:MurR/RpiR family transcriptional regulator [Plantibacter sp. Mn2098]|uniref:MurR/RpiR family transcriptional regulator n=1 Tax=Plantibacter sp. Mn2098 TaxID=3395266 RepID=UPI003BC0C919